MANNTQVVKDNIWQDRIPAADKYYKKWETAFKCDILEKYYEGQQWKNERDQYNPYTINKFFEIIQGKIANFVPTFPKYTVSATPGNSDYNLDLAARSSQLKEDILNTIINNNKQHFAAEIELAYKDQFFRFGILEVGYAADWIINPAAEKPLLQSGVNNEVMGKDRYKVKKEPKELPVDERIFIKHVGAKRFRVGGIDHKYLDRCTWCGYYEWVYKDDLLALPIMNRIDVEEATYSVPDSSTYDKEDNQMKVSGALKIWHIWDIRSKQRIIVLDSKKTTIFQRGFKRLPLFDYRTDMRLSTEGFYPVPPAFHWLSPQDEINETREQLRSHRRRFTRKFQVVEGFVDDIEIEKFESGEDGALIKVKKENAITGIQDPPLGQSNQEAMVTSADDLNRISGISSEGLSGPDRTTATQANIVAQRSSVRESGERDRVVAWFIGIGREILLTVRDKFTLGIWAKLSSDPGGMLDEYQQNKDAYQWVTSEDLNDGYDFKVEVDVTSISSNAQNDEKQKFLEFMAVLTQYPQIAFSPALIQEAAIRVGYRNQKVLAEFQKQALMQELGRQVQMQQAGVNLPAPGNAAQQTVAQQAPNAMEKIRNQIQNQLPGVQ